MLEIVKRCIACVKRLHAEKWPRLFGGGALSSNIVAITEEPRFNEGPMDWSNMSAKTRFRYIEVLFHTFHCEWGRKYRSLYRGLRM